MAEFAILRLFDHHPEQKVIYISPLKALAKERIQDWKVKFAPLKKEIVELTGDSQPDLEALQKAHIIISTPEKWDSIS
jgi:activating signal cointegrator complex subunit 3